MSNQPPTAHFTSQDLSAIRQAVLRVIDDGDPKRPFGNNHMAWDLYEDGHYDWTWATRWQPLPPPPQEQR